MEIDESHKENDDDYTTFASLVNKHYGDFKLSELSANNFKWLIFVQGLISNNDTKIRRSFLNNLDNEPNLTLPQITEDFGSVRQDSKLHRENRRPHINNIRNKKQTSHRLHRVNH